MRALEIMRSELERFGLANKMPVEKRRALVLIAKRAKRHGRNARAAITRAIQNGVKT